MRFVKVDVEELLTSEVRYVKSFISKDFNTKNIDGYNVYVQNDRKQELKIKVKSGFDPNQYALGEVVKFKNVTGLAYCQNGRLAISLKADSVELPVYEPVRETPVVDLVAIYNKNNEKNKNKQQR